MPKLEQVCEHFIKLNGARKGKSESEWQATISFYRYFIFQFRPIKDYIQNAN